MACICLSAASYARPVAGEKRREPRRGGVVEQGFWLLLPVKVTRPSGPEPLFNKDFWQLIVKQCLTCQRHFAGLAAFG
ncbi:hypothetical protein AAY24_14015 [Sedimenticola thiotaurini]|uniref:Uncharacterized protein n=1 Tax=Sedimenticola thiotaurini TaxID=1543721 RepID=A0A0F7K270_9GAMM|nr:hypothetical protein AAY24_14015 [Sedimenticola thiotaurini]